MEFSHNHGLAHLFGESFRLISHSVEVALYFGMELFSFSAKFGRLRFQRSQRLNITMLRRLGELWDKLVKKIVSYLILVLVGVKVLGNFLNHSFVGIRKSGEEFFNVLGDEF